MGAFDMVDRRGEGDHLLDPAPRIGAGEVLTHPAPKIGRGPDVEHLGSRSTEEVHPRVVGQSAGQYPLSALGVRHIGQIGAQILVGRHALVSHSFDQRMQHVDGGAGVVQGAVGGLGAGPDQPRQCRQPNAGRLLAAQHPAGQPHRAQHRRTGPVNIALLGRGAQEADVEPRVVGDQNRAVRKLKEHRQYRRDGRGITHHRGGDPGEFDDLRRDAALRVHQGGELTDDLSAADLDRSDLGDRVL